MMNNKYYIWYNTIINHAINQHRVKGGDIFYENHHIIPKSLGGDNSKSNLVLLTAKEHVVCHHLLTKFTVGPEKSKMNYAFWSLVNGWGNTRSGHRITARQYANLKEEIAKQISKQNTGRPSAPVSPEGLERIRLAAKQRPRKRGKDNHNFGKKRPGIGGRKKGTGWSETERANQMKTRSVPGYHDFLKNPERGKKISDSQKGRPGTSTGTIWCNDGVKEYQVTEIPIGFNKGRLNIKNAAKIGLRWFNNGIENRQFRDGKQPEGFNNGRIRKK
jgi:hypothetical protein